MNRLEKGGASTPLRDPPIGGRLSAQMGTPVPCAAHLAALIFEFVREGKTTASNNKNTHNCVGHIFVHLAVVTKCIK